MGQFPPGIPYADGQNALGATGNLERQQALTRLARHAVAHTRYDNVSGQVTMFGPLKGSSNLLFARVLGPFGSSAFLYVGQGNPAEIVRAENLEGVTSAGHQDEASWSRPGIPVYDGWSIGIFWDRPLTWGTALGKVYLESVSL